MNINVLVSSKYHIMTTFRMTSAEKKMKEVEEEWIALENEEKRFLLNKKETEHKLEVYHHWRLQGFARGCSRLNTDNKRDVFSLYSTFVGWVTFFLFLHPPWLF